MLLDPARNRPSQRRWVIPEPAIADTGITDAVMPLHLEPQVCFCTLPARVREGAPIGRSLAASKLFPPMTIHLISSGEASGQLEAMLDRAAINQERELDGAAQLFRLAAGGKEASRASVKLGRASVSTIEVVEGLQPGDQVVLSDMSAWDSYDRIRLK